MKRLYGSLTQYHVLMLRRLQALVWEPAVCAGSAPSLLSSAPALAASTTAAPGPSSEAATRASPSAYTPVVAHDPTRCWRCGGWHSGPAAAILPSENIAAILPPENIVQYCCYSALRKYCSYSTQRN